MDRIERHDVLNALGLAVALVVMGFIMLWGLRGLGGALGGVIDTGPDETLVEGEGTTDGATPGTSTTSTTAPTTTTSTTLPPSTRPPAEITVLVSNAAQVGGIAGRASDAIEAGGFNVLTPTNSDSQDATEVYHLPDYATEALDVARLVNVDAANLRPMEELTALQPGTAHVVVVVGRDNAVPDQRRPTLSRLGA